MENEKYVLTIDGPDCTGKTTIWKELNNKGINSQIRGIVSNIAYGLKYNRNIDEMIDMYNKTPINYYVILFNLNRAPKIDRMAQRLKDIFNAEDIPNELRSMADTFLDNDYFDKAVNLLNNKYKGKIIVRRINTAYPKEELVNTIKNMIEVDKVTTYTNDETMTLGNIEAGRIVLNETLKNFEAEAKEHSEFKYIVFRVAVDKAQVIRDYIDSLDENSVLLKMVINYLELTGKSHEELYDAVENCYKYDKVTNETISDFISNYTLAVDVKTQVTCDVDTTLSISLADYSQYDYDDIVDYIRDNSDCMDEISSDVEYNIQYDGDYDMEVEDIK